MKYFLISLITLFTIFPDNICAQDKQLKKAINELYNFKFSKSLSELNNLSLKYPLDLRAYYYKSLIYSWFYLGSLNEAYKDSFEFYSEKTLDIANKIPAGDDNRMVEKLFWTGMVNYNKSVVNARSNQYASAIVSLNEMRKNLSNAIEIDSTFTDAYMALGLSNFAFSEVPAALKWAANLVGFNADKETGLKYVQMVSENGKILKTDAKFYLSQIYSRSILDFQKADELLTTLVKTYPGNQLFNYAFAWIRNETGKSDNAEKILNKIISSDDSIFNYVKSNSHLLLANLLFNKELYDSAITHYNQFRKHRINNDYLGFANLKTGLCYEFMENRKEAIKWYQKTIEGNEDIEEDIYAMKLSKSLVSKPISRETKLQIEFERLLKLYNFSELNEKIQNVYAEGNLSPRLFLIASYYHSCALLSEGKFQNALDRALEGLKQYSDEEDWITNFTYYNCAVALYNLDRQSESLIYLKKIENNSSSDFFNTLKNKVYTLQRKIKNITG